MSAVKKPTPEERLATQNFLMKEILSVYQNHRLNASRLREIFKALREGMRAGSCAWAFREKYIEPGKKICVTCEYWDEKTGECSGQTVFPASVSSVVESPRKKMLWNDGKNCPAYR